MTVYENALSIFEDNFQGAFADLAEWCSAGLSGGIANLAERKSQLSGIRSLCVALHGSITRWSPAGLQEQTPSIGDATSNALAIIAGTSWSLCLVFSDAVHTVLNFCVAKVGCEGGGGTTSKIEITPNRVWVQVGMDVWGLCVSQHSPLP